jgi:AcrR family transcriptional regulator
MSKPVKTRGYHSPLRAEQAQRTRAAILAAARRLFGEKGYAATTVAAIAAEAGVAVDTVYAAVGPKSAVFRLLVETAISGTDQAVPAEERDYVRRIREARTAREKIEIYAAAVRGIGERMAPLFLVLHAAAPQAAELAELRREIGERRARNMRLFAEDLAATGELRPDLSLDEVADIVWSMNSAELYALLVRERGWAPPRYERFLTDAWCRLLLRHVPPPEPD